MSNSIIDFSQAPSDHLERLLWLSGVQEAVDTALDAEYRKCYFHLRLQHRFEEALALGYHSTKRALAWTRQENNRSGRNVRWGDGLDPTSRKAG